MILYDQIILLFHKKTKQFCILLKMYAEQSTSLRDILTYFKEHEDEICYLRTDEYGGIAITDGVYVAH